MLASPQVNTGDNRTDTLTCKKDLKWNKNEEVVLPSLMIHAEPFTCVWDTSCMSPGSRMKRSFSNYEIKDGRIIDMLFMGKEGVIGT